MDSKTLNTFKESRQALLDGYNKAKSELLTLETELIKLGVIPSATTPPVVPSVPSLDGIKSDLSKKIIGAITAGAKTQKEIEKALRGKKVYGKLQNMVEQKLLKKESTAEGVVYVICQ